MTDQRKSAQVKQQLRNPDGTYANEGKTSSMPSGDMLERFERRQQADTGDAPVETYEAGIKRMQELDQRLIDIANKEYTERKFGPDDEGYRVESGLYVSREEFEKLPELDRNRYIAWGNDYMEGNEDAWNDPQRMDDLARESAEDDDAEVYLTEPELTYTDDMDYSFGEYLESKGCDPQSAEEGANMALQGHPGLELTGSTYPQVWPTDTGKNHRRAKLFYLSGSKGWRVTFSDGRGDIKQTIIDYRKRRYGQRLLRSDQHCMRSIQNRFRLGRRRKQKEEALTSTGSSSGHPLRMVVCSGSIRHRIISRRSFRILIICGISRPYIRHRESCPMGWLRHLISFELVSVIYKGWMIDDE